MAKRKLTLKQTKFIKEYIKTGNGTQSALTAYNTKDYNSANQIAVENLQKPTVKMSIEEELNKSGLDLGTISNELKSIAVKEAEKPLSYSEKLKAIEMAARFHGLMDKTTTKLTVSLSQRLEGQSFSELKNTLTNKKDTASKLLQDLE